MPSNSKKKNDVLSVTITVTDRALQRRPRCRVVNISLHSLRKDLSSSNKNLCTETSFSLRDAHSAVVSFIVLPVLPTSSYILLPFCVNDLIKIVKAAATVCYKLFIYATYLPTDCTLAH